MSKDEGLEQRRFFYKDKVEVVRGFYSGCDALLLEEKRRMGEIVYLVSLVDHRECYIPGKYLEKVE